MKLKEIMKHFTKNVYLSFFSGMLYSVAVLFMSGSIIQAFMVHYGVSEDKVGIYTTVLNIISVVILIFSAQISNKEKNSIKAYARFTYPIALCFLGLLPICFFTNDMSVGMVFVIAMVFGVMQAIFIGLRDVFAYKTPYQLYNIKDYPLIMSVGGVVGGGVGIGSSALFAFMSRMIDYEKLMPITIVIAAVLMVLAGVLISLCKPIDPSINGTEEAPDAEKKKIGLKELFTLPEFSCAIIPGFVRGIFNGVFSLIAVILISEGFTETDVADLVIVSQVASIVGSFLFAVLSVKFNSRYIGLTFGIVTLVMPMLSIHNKVVLLVVYTVVYLSKVMVDYAVPTILSRVINYEIAGSYHAWRLLIMNAGSTVSTFVVSRLIGTVPSWIIFTVAALCKLACVIGYCFAKPMRTKYTDRLIHLHIPKLKKKEEK